jgi:hypothetical protein
MNTTKDNLTQLEQEQLAKDNCILRVVSGSNAYGTNTPSSDWDERGIFVTSQKEIIFPVNYFEQVELSENDVVLFELKKYMTLLQDQNPNILEIIWTAPTDILHITETGQQIIDHRDKFLTNNVKNTFAAYAQSQMHRIKGHNKWINNPQPETAPQQKQFISVILNMTDNPEFNKKAPLDNFYSIDLGNNQFALWDKRNSSYEGANWINKDGCIVAITKEKRSEFLQKNRNPDIIVKYNKDIYEKSMDNWKNYWNWRKNRNVSRSELEVKFGYDTKHAMHIIRLLHSCIEILDNQRVPVKQKNPSYLLDIRNGLYTYEEFFKETEKLMLDVERLAAKCTLPSEISKEYTQDFIFNLYNQHWSSRIEKTPNKNIKP